MATITEDYVSFETAKLLKEKGFNEPCYGLFGIEFDEDDNQRIAFSRWTNGPKQNSFPDEFFTCSAPTHQMAMKWLREVHDCSIEITSNGYLMNNDATWECDIKFRHRLYFRPIQCENTYEDCAKAAIRYCLENLI